MATRITRDILESYLNCKYKAFLKHTGQEGVKSAYEDLLVRAKNEVRLQASDKILARHSEVEVARNIPLTASALKQGPLFILCATLEDNLLSVDFDGLQRVPGASRVGDFHYVPMLFHESRQVHKEQRLLLEIYGLMLARVQGRTPGVDIVWHDKECKATKVRLNPDLRKTQRLLEETKQVQSGEPPRLLLTDHCQVCEFRQRCHRQPVQQDNLSLLRGVGEKEIKSSARKGITTMTQLALTFRPRRNGKRPERRCNRYHALEAIAIRDKRIYVFGTPELRSSLVQIYVDTEGNPEDGAVYLIGMIVVKDGQETRHSFWADTKEQESGIIDRLLAVISQYEDYLVYCHGRYEREFLKRLREQSKRK